MERNHRSQSMFTWIVFGIAQMPFREHGQEKEAHSVRAAHEAAEESKLHDDIVINETESECPNDVHA